MSLLDRYDEMQRRPFGTNTALSAGNQRGVGGATGSQFRRQEQAFGRALRLLNRQARRGDADAAMNAIDVREEAMTRGYMPGGIENVRDKNRRMSMRIGSMGRQSRDMVSAAQYQRQENSQPSQPSQSSQNGGFQPENTRTANPNASPGAGRGYPGNGTPLSSRFSSIPTVTPQGRNDLSQEAMGTPEQQATIRDMMDENSGRAKASNNRAAPDWPTSMSAPANDYTVSPRTATITPVSGSSKINRLTGLPFGYRPGDVVPGQLSPQATESQVRQTEGGATASPREMEGAQRSIDTRGGSFQGLPPARNMDAYRGPASQREQTSPTPRADGYRAPSQREKWDRDAASAVARKAALEKTAAQGEADVKAGTWSRSQQNEWLRNNGLPLPKGETVEGVKSGASTKTSTGYNKLTRGPRSKR